MGKEPVRYPGTNGYVPGRLVFPCGQPPKEGSGQPMTSAASTEEQAEHTR